MLWGWTFFVFLLLGYKIQHKIYPRWQGTFNSFFFTISSNISFRMSIIVEKKSNKTVFSTKKTNNEDAHKNLCLWKTEARLGYISQISVGRSRKQRTSTLEQPHRLLLFWYQNPLLKLAVRCHFFVARHVWSSSRGCWQIKSLHLNEYLFLIHFFLKLTIFSFINMLLQLTMNF